MVRTPQDEENLVDFYRDRINQMYKDLYLGEGKNNPPITTRLSMQEENYQRLNNNISKMTWLIIGTLVTALAQFVFELIKKGL